jgi:HD-GYP domain-containing protein (c-di-GMP phosphodiesterase class II)
MPDTQHIHLYDIASLISDVLDLINSRLVNHHKLVAHIASVIAEQLGIPVEKQTNLILAALMHDIGAFSLSERLDALNFEIENPHKHAEIGAGLLLGFEPLADAATLILCHHQHWGNGEGASRDGWMIPTEAHIIHLADRISVLINMNQEILGQKNHIRETIRSHSGGMFLPEAVDAFLKVSQKEAFWFSTSPNILRTLLESKARSMPMVSISMEGIIDFARLFCRIIDFRSRFTATHSSGVAACAGALAELAGMSEFECHQMQIAGFFHDLGKLAVPLEILEKKDALEKDEFNIIKKHPFYTFHLLNRISLFSSIRDWAAFHHERLDGNGYPFGFDARRIPIGSRIISVADIFTAVAEDRPFRRAMKMGAAIQILDQMARSGAIDPQIVSILKNNLDHINHSRDSAQKSAAFIYHEFETHHSFALNTLMQTSNSFVAPHNLS